MLKETHVQAWMVVHALINGYGRTKPGCRDELLAFLFQLSYCKVTTSTLTLIVEVSCSRQNEVPVPSAAGVLRIGYLARCVGIQ